MGNIWSENESKQDHLRMNVSLDQTIIFGWQIFLDHRSLSSIGQKIFIDIFLKKKENYILCETRKSVGIGTEAKKQDRATQPLRFATYLL